MLLPLQLRKCFQVIALVSLVLSSEGLNLAASYPSLKDRKTGSQEFRHSESTSNHVYITPLLDSSDIGRTLLMSSVAPWSSSQLPEADSSLKSPNDANSLDDPIPISSVTKDLNSMSSPMIPSSIGHILFDSLSVNLFDSLESRSTLELPSYVISSTRTEEYLHSLSFNSNFELPSSMISSAISEEFPFSSSHTPSLSTADISSLKSDIDKDVNVFSHFHTPLMSLLVAPSSINSWHSEPSLITSAFNHIAQTLTTISSNNEISNPNHLPVPVESDHKKLLMLVLRAEDCTKFSKADFEKMLGKLMLKFGFNDVVPEVSNAKCYSHLNINVTVGNPNPTLRFLPNMDGKNNFTVDVLNRTFRIVKIEKMDVRLEKTKNSNSTSSIIAAVADHETVAYIASGVPLGIILVLCLSVFCVKCCCLSKSSKRCGVPKGTHVRLRPEDYTLTPIPRPNSLYVDYYRGSATADIFSTTSAGSIASTTPTVEQGVVQPFDTSIVPLEDSSNLPLNNSRNPSVESVPVQSDLKTFNIQSLSGKGLHTVSTDSKEHLNPKTNSRKVEIKTTGVANPTFQRY